MVSMTTTGRSVRVKHLLRTSGPGAEAAHAVRRLVHAVAEWREDAVLDLTFGSHAGHLTFVLAQHGVPQPGWESDAEWALREIAALEPATEDADEDPVVVSDVVEIRSTRDIAPTLTSSVAALPGGEDQPESEGARLLRQYERARSWTPWPQPLADDLSETARLLAEHPDVMLRFRLAPATPLEIDMLGDSLVESWTGDNAHLFAYLGRPVRLQAFLATRNGHIPARAKALVRRWASGLTLTPLPPADAVLSWSGEGTLRGAVVPEGVALSILRVPAAGQEPFPGMATEHPPTRNRPLDPVPPTPRTPIRVGSARTIATDAVDAALDIQDLVRHSFIEGRSGSGKSTLLAALAREVIRQGYGCTLLDPHGTTVDQILTELPERSDRTYVVRHEDTTHPIPLDIITGDDDQIERVIDTFIEMVQLMYDAGHTGIVGPRWRRWFGLIAKAAHRALGERASLVAITEIGGDVARVAKLARAIADTDPALAKSLMDEIVNNRSNEAAEMLAWSISKLHPIVSTAQMRAILGTGHDAVDMRGFMDDGKSVLVDLASPKLGVPASRMLGALWLLKHWIALGERRAPEKPHIVIVDEAHLFQFGALPNLLAEGRKFGIGVVVATQFIGQLRPDLAESLEANAGSLFTLATGLPYAERSSIRLAGWPVEQIVRLPALTAAASLSLDGTRTEPFTLHVDHHDRMEATDARGPLAKERARSATLRSLRELWDPFAELSPVSGAEIDETLAATSRHREPPVRKVPKPPVPPPPPKFEDSSGFLDDWLAKRSSMQDDPVDTEVSTQTAPTPVDPA